MTTRHTLPCVVALMFAACGSDDGGGGGGDTADVQHDTASVDTTPSVTATALGACDGPAKIYVETEAGEREVVDWRGGDTVLRGYATCDGDVDRFRLVATCGGELTARLTWAQEETELAVTLRADEVDGGTLSEGPATVTLPMAAYDDADASGDYALDVDVSCVSGAATTWQLDLDTPSTAPLPKAANGWPEDLLPQGWSSCEDGRFPDIGVVGDQYGHDDVTLGQFYGNMTLVSIAGTWCGPCQTAAAEATALTERLEAAGAEWGFTHMELVLDDVQQLPAFGDDASVWAEAYGLVDPVLVGAPWELVHASCIDGIGIPVFVVLDPLLRVRQVLGGYGGADELEAAVEDAWSAFHAEHPEWVSPRCAGVGGAERLCLCDDAATDGDADGDGVSDACDVCATGRDRVDWDGDGVPNACDDAPGESPYPRYREIGAIEVEFGGYSEGGGVLSDEPLTGGNPFMRTPYVWVRLRDKAGNLFCDVHRELPAGASAIPDAGAGVLASWAFPEGGELSSGFASCAGMVDPARFGADPDAALARIFGGLAFFDRCPTGGCEGADDPVFAMAPEDYHCFDAAEVCETYIVGTSAWRPATGFLGTGETPLSGVGWVTPVEDGQPAWTTFIPAGTVRADLPAGFYGAVLSYPPSVLDTVLAGATSE